MPLFEFTCSKCPKNLIYEKAIPFAAMKNDEIVILKNEHTNIEVEVPAWSVCYCPEHPTEILIKQLPTEINIIGKKDKIEPKHLGRYATEGQHRLESQKAEAIMNEGFASKQEMQDSYGYASEREKILNKTPGSLTGNIKAPNPNDKAAVEAIRQRDNKKKQEQIRMRRRI